MAAKRAESRPPTRQRGQRGRRSSGFWLFPVVNILLLLFLRSNPGMELSGAAGTLPWLVNGLILLILYARWPQTALGYLGCFGSLIGIGLGAAIIFAVGCVPFAVSLAGGPLALLGLAWFLFVTVYGGWRFLGWALGGVDKWLRAPDRPEAQTGADRGAWPNTPLSFDELRRRLSDEEREALDWEDYQAFQRGDLEIGDDGELRPTRRGHGEE